MSTIGVNTDRRFYRDADRAVLGGVCAGLAGYLGFNLKTTRFLAFIAFLMAMPVAVIAYLAVVFLIPAATSDENPSVPKDRMSRRERKRQRKRSAEAHDGPSMKETIDRRCQTLDERLVRLERHVTSRRFQLEQEINRL